MNKFREYLQQQGLSSNTSVTYDYLTQRFLTYVESKNIKERQVDYTVVLKYITHLRRNNNDKSINLNLVAIRYYFNFKRFKNNPVKIHIKRKPTVISTNTLSTEELYSIYDDFKYSDTPTSIRNKVLLGLVIFQGVKSVEIPFIKVDDINMDKLTIKLPQTSRSNFRVLSLHIKQVLLLNKYLTQTREELLLNHIDTSDKLIITGSKKNCTRSIIEQLNKTIGKLPNKPSLRFIRTSVIRNWLQHHDLRKVQYMSGHRYISSTERYVTQDLQKLKKNVVKFHPF